MTVASSSEDSCLYLALPSEKNMQSVSAATRKLFRNAGFTSGNDNQSDLEITSNGFQFLLLSPVQQMWTYMIEYLKLEVSENQDVRELLEILIRIILCIDRGDDPSHIAYQLGEDWTERQNELIMHMRELGLIFIRKRKDGLVIFVLDANVDPFMYHTFYMVFFLTPLLWNLSTGNEGVGWNESRRGNIIVETNFRLYAYTGSSLQLAILSTFTEMIYRFHDMSVGILSRDSVRRALQFNLATHNGIVTNQYLAVMVADQIRLWEDERRRLTLSEATLYSTFESENEFIGVRNFSSDESILLWADSDKKLVIVTDEGHDKVKAWWKRNKGSV
uniref:General transcription factor IIH subunit 4 n=1 Tax=Heterorhabditis bacteriophora TaxID=37862 RepID=A0A1I7XRH7_HETBA